MPAIQANHRHRPTHHHHRAPDPSATPHPAPVRLHPGHHTASGGGHVGAHHVTHAHQPHHAPTHHHAIPHHATLGAFDSGSYTATIAITTSPDVYLSGVPVSRAIASTLLTVGAIVSVIFFDHNNPADAMVVGIY